MRPAERRRRNCRSVSSVEENAERVRADVETARALIAAAEANVTRESDTVANAQATVRKKQAALEQARADLERTEIRAPVSGEPSLSGSGKSTHRRRRARSQGAVRLGPGSGRPHPHPDLERTREIGLRMAVGARRRDILARFLVEAVMLSVARGIVGIGIGLVASRIAPLARWTTKIPLDAIALAFAFATAVGVFFGFYPARKASGLDPIEAHRYE